MTSASPLIIVGMHRSRTSLSASWVHSMGLNLGDNLIAPGIGNEKGYFEDTDFYDFHELVFRNHDIESAALQFPIDFELSYDEHDGLDTLVKKKMKNNVQWGWKEPRTCLFLDYYHDKLPDAKYIILYRPCNDVVDSLLRRDIKMDINKYSQINLIRKLKFKIKKKFFGKTIRKNRIDNYIRIWTAYNRKITELMDKLDPSEYVVCDQSSLIKSGKKVFNKLVEWGYRLEYVPISSIIDENMVNKASVNNYHNSNYPEVELLTNFFEEKIKSNPGY